LLRHHLVSRSVSFDHSVCWGGSWSTGMAKSFAGPTRGSGEGVLKWAAGRQVRSRRAVSWRACAPGSSEAAEEDIRRWGPGKTVFGSTLSVQSAKGELGLFTTLFFMRERRLPESLDATEADPDPREEGVEEPLENMDEMRRFDRFFSTTDMMEDERRRAAI